ncbi:MAG: secretin N-terminal domain-containing protein [Opitutales bacterium]|jgi:general secretion pathway protein D|nr:secretin N-terminal domain-containing protein [Opitutales bacterium]
MTPKRIFHSNRAFGIKGLLFLWVLALSNPVAVLQVQAQNSAVAPLILRGDSVDSVLALLEKLTGRSIIRPQGLPAPLFNFTSQKPLTVAERIVALESLLALNGIAVIPQGELFLKVVPSSSVTGRSPQFAEGELADIQPTDGIYSRFFTLQHLTTSEIQPLIQPFLSPGTGQIFLYEKANAMLITDSMVNLQRVEEILEEVDRPSNPNVIVKFYDIEHALAADIVAQVDSIIAAGYGKYLNANSTIRADERTNQVIVVTHPSNLPIIEQFILEIDKDQGLSVFNEAIALRHGDAAEIAGILNEIVSGQADPNTTGQNNRQNQTQTRPNPPAGQTPQPTPSVTVRGTRGEGSGEYGLQFSELLTIVADERSNALIVTGTKRDIEQAKQLIEKIDVLLPQVRIDVVIAEVSLTDTTGTGIQQFGFNYAGDWDGSSFDGFSLGDGFTVTPKEGAEGIFPNALTFDMIFDIADTKSNIRLKSVPTIVATHNQEANIVVGEARPVVTGTQTSGVSGALSSSVQYRDIGIELTVTPLIGADGSIQIEIEQVVDNLGGTILIDGNEQPIITTRRASSFLTVADGELITLAGFQEAFTENTDSKVAILGDIPIVNLLFRPKSQDVRDTELIFFIRPKILRTSSDANQDALESAAKFSDRELVNDVLPGTVKAMGNQQEVQPASAQPIRKGFNK